MEVNESSTLNNPMAIPIMIADRKRVHLWFIFEEIIPEQIGAINNPTDIRKNRDPA
jgi:hypothetical protein